MQADRSGDGADPNITGRYPTPYATGGPEVNKMVVLDLTPESKGNANGVVTEDFTTSRLAGDVRERPNLYRVCADQAGDNAG